MIAQSRRMRNEIMESMISDDTRLIGGKGNKPIGTQMHHFSLFTWLCICFITLDWVSVAQGYQDYQTWNLPDGAIARFGKGRISEGDRVLAFSPDGKLLAVSTEIGVWIYDVKTTEERTLFLATDHSFFRGATAFSPDGTQLAAADAGGVKLWNVATRTNVLTFQSHAGLVNSVAFSPDGSKLAVAGRKMKLTEIETGKTIRVFAGHTDWINSVSFAPDGTKLATGSQDKTVKLWEVDTGENIDTLIGHKDEVRCVAFSPDSTKLASGSMDHTIKLWDVETGRYVDTLGRSASTSTTTQIFWSVLGRITNAGGHTFWVNSVAFSPDGTTLASGSSDGTVKLWQVKTGKNVGTLVSFGGISNPVAFSPDGEIIACTSDRHGEVKLWEIATEKTIDTITGHINSVDFTSFSPDGTTLAAAYGDEVRLWNVDTGRKNYLTKSVYGFGSMWRVLP